MNPFDIQKIIYFSSKLNVLENGYNLINSLIYSVIGVIIYFFVVYPYLLFRKIKINNYFIFSVFFFVVIGAVIKMFSFSQGTLYFVKELSNNPLSLSFYLYYPNIFILLLISYFVIFESSLLISKRFKIDFYKLIFYVSLILMLFFLFILIYNSVNFLFSLKLLLFSVIIFLVIFFIFKLLKQNMFLKKINSFVFFSQILDSFITFYFTYFFSTQFIEKHVLSNILISISPFLFLIVKILLILFIIYLIDKYIKDLNLNAYFKLFIIIIGYSTALRNLFLISLTFI